MDEMSLPPELENYAADAVAEGRYRDRAELVAAGVALLRERDATRAAFLATVLAAQERAKREGCLSGEEVAERVAPRSHDGRERRREPAPQSLPGRG